MRLLLAGNNPDVTTTIALTAISVSAGTAASTKLEPEFKQATGNGGLSCI